MIDLIKRFEGSPEVMEISAGGKVFEEGEPAEKMYVILEGEVRLTLHGQPLAMEVGGGIIGEMALIESEPRSASARALTDCRLVAIDKADFLDMIRESPEFAIHIMQVLTRRLRLANEILSAY
ncbi:MAG: cyclic nucleotide-binding domain-containing protein [Xanthomonadales bacterium]|nr:cyclic nucleotide-binding domain-containing protein [Xanthomonadales bacterium]NIN59820.1 cyclic nucleotide-binding domain-containing protein [Xanthomonadales bacterium]NIN75195.1 cyclic nucleotide-binding domain-containing protein [Xanthomonadales bacterium]NIO14172.1 cyclic nucleotide-binding domain-containing protein [Xanthomonadales bacterium]NIP12213.1 cyclic nucleotide-binding domain-containing protein [Xanthomonadales bacterium]